MNEKNDVHICSPPYENVHIVFFFFFLFFFFCFFFFIHTSRKRNKSTVNSYDLISYHFHTKSEGKQP